MEPKTQKEKFGQGGARDKGRILLITDEEDVINQESLASTGVEVVGVSGGPAALLSLQRCRPHIVIASTAIKGISTRELGRLLVQAEASVPLILVGIEKPTSERRLAALSAGAFDYFQIPAESELLALRVAQLISLRIVMERLRVEADVDHLTGLANRRRFRIALSREVERWRRYGVGCSLLLLDIDHMKAINDRFGHPIGDAVIRHIAATLAHVSRDNDTAARLGGEEFALLLAGIGDAKAVAAAERLHSLLAEQPAEGVGDIGVSIGVASCPAHATSERTLYTASDRALYAAKNQGRNRVSVAPLLQEKLPGV